MNEGLAVLAELKLPWTRFSRTLRTQYLNSISKPLPQLDPVPKGRPGGSGRKAPKSKQKKEKGAKKSRTCAVMGVARLTGYFSALAEAYLGCGQEVLGGTGDSSPFFL